MVSNEGEVLYKELDKETLRSGTTIYVKDGVIHFKECTKCLKILSAGNFNKASGSKTGLNSSCKECQKEYRAEWSKRNPNYDREYNKKNPEKVRRKNRKFREENPDYMLNWYRENKERQDQYKRDWMLKNPKWESEHVRKYRLRRPEVSAVSQSRRRAAKYGAVDTLTTEEYMSVLDKFGHSCALTGKKKNLTIDHVVPLNIVTVGNVFENVLPLNASVNASKSGSNIFEWYSKNKHRFGIKEDLFEDAIEYLANINGMSAEEYRRFVYEQHDKGAEIRNG